MQIGILSEVTELEKRVAITPRIVKKLIELNHHVIIESGAGAGCFISDEEFLAAGANISNKKKDVLDSDVIFKVNPLTEKELADIRQGALVISFFEIEDQRHLINLYQKKQLSLVSMNDLPRVSRAQSMDALSSQASIAGYKAVLLGANYLSKYMPMLMTAAGTVLPSKVLVFGAGVAGLQAIATAKRLGAYVEAIDVRDAVKEQVESLGAKFVVPENSIDDAEDEDGYAKAVSEEKQNILDKLSSKHVAAADLVITTAQIPHKKAPVLVTQSMVELMAPGSVIIDLAAASGGNCALTERDKVIQHNGVYVYGMTNIVSTMAASASQLYANNMYNLFTGMFADNDFKDRKDEILQAALVFSDGDVFSKRAKQEIDRSKK
jgi:H+-translocating NAD(P) transhydrogenase subunit alpha